jgi:hypothetical protein
MWQKSVAAGDSAELDFGGVLYDFVNLVATGNGLVCTPIGAQ